MAISYPAIVFASNPLQKGLMSFIYWGCENAGHYALEFDRGLLFTFSACPPLESSAPQSSTSAEHLIVVIYYDVNNNRE